MNSTTGQNTKYCKFCGQIIDAEAVICVKCGKQVEELRQAQTALPNIVINNQNTNQSANANTNSNTNVNTAKPVKSGKPKNKWVALLLLIFLGYLGAHKFYEGKIFMGIFYIFTVGFFGIGLIIDLVVLLFKPNPYYVK